MMADVACFCGCLYSFDGGGGACPQCGEYASLTTGAELKVHRVLETDLHFLAQLVDPADCVDRRRRYAPVTRRRRASAAWALLSACTTSALASAPAHCWSGTFSLDSTTPRTSRQISAVGLPFRTASVMS